MNNVKKASKNVVSQLPPQGMAVLDRLLNCASRHSSKILLVAVCCGIAVIGVLVVRDLQSTSEEVQRLFRESIGGMQRAGALQYDAQETRRAILYALTTADSNLQLVYADQTRAADHRVSNSIEDYARQANTQDEIVLAAQLRQDWTAYLAVRDEVLASILEGSIHDAVTRDLAGGVPAFERVRKDLDEVKRLYAEEAERSARNLERTSRSSARRLAGILSFTFLLLSAGVWAIQRSQMLGRMQFAKLQMEFVASVSHELRTPLAVIRSAADNLADGIVQTGEALRRYGLVLRHQSRRMTELVDQILTFASTEDGVEPLPLQSIAIDQIVRAVLSHTESAERESGFRIEVRVDQGLPRALGNLNGITQVLTNLIVNAIKYGGDDRLITLHASATENPREGLDEILIAVTDRGMGIDTAEIHHVFEPFYRSPRVKNAQIHGTGLGLSVARRIAESMGGRISVSSQIARGSTFTLHLKTATEAASQLSAIDAPPARLMST